MSRICRAGGLGLLLLLFTSLPVLAQRETGTIRTAEGASATCVTSGAGQSCVRTNVPGSVGSVTVQVTGTGTFTLQFEVSSDGGATWYQPGGVNLSSYSRESSTTGSGRWGFNNSGITHLQVRASAYTSGAPVVALTGGAGGIIAPLAAGSITGGNDAAGTVGAAVPGSASYTGLNIGGNLTGWTGFSLGTVRAGALAIVDGSGNQITSFGGGTQYTEGDTDASITGTALMLEGAANTLVAAPGTVADGLLVNLGANNDVTAAQSGTWNITNVSGTVSLPTGASTAANQTTIAGYLDGVEGLLTTIDVDTGNLVTVFGTASLVLGTQADNLANTSDGLQTSSFLYGFDGTTWDRLTATAGSLNVNITGGSTSGPTDTDDGSIAGGQTVGIVQAQMNYWTGSAWARVTGPTDATHGLPVLTTGPLVMGHGSSTAPTAVDPDDAVNAWFTLNGAQVATLVNGSGTNAFGTAGTGSAAVLTVQGNASGTAVPVSGTVTVTATDLDVRIGGSDTVQVQSNSANLATQTTAAAIQTAVELIDNASFADEAAFTYASSGVRAIGLVAESTTDTLSDGQVGAPLMTLDRIPYSTVVPTANVNQAASECAIVSAASTNSTSCKASPGNFYGVDIINTTTTLYYLRLYNSSSAPTCSSATGFVRSIPIPPAGSAGQAGGLVRVGSLPVGYSTGIGYCLTGGASSTDNTNAATGIYGAIVYK